MRVFVSVFITFSYRFCSLSDLGLVERGTDFVVMLTGHYTEEEEEEGLVVCV